MEGKTLSKDEEKKELSLEKILEIEKAYFDLMKAYSSCLTTLKLKKLKYRFSLEWYKELYTKHFPFPFFNPQKWSTESLLSGNILAPRITRWRIGRQVDLLREAFLLLIAQNRNKIDSKIIKQFELYCEDMNKLSDHLAKSGLIALFYSSIPAGLLGILYHITSVSFEAIIILIGIILYLLFYGFLFFVIGFWGSKRIFSEATVPEKEKKIFVLIQEYVEFV